MELTLPRMVRIHQPVQGPVVTDPGAEVRSGLAGLGLQSRVSAGQTVAITAGSRGISGMLQALRAVVSSVHELGAHPFVFPAMGSHGGASAAGQEAVLAAYGITEEGLGCPVRSSMETVGLGRSPRGLTLWQDALAASADHVVVCNRIKPHTMFGGPVESGLAKMLMIGMGKEKGASLVHRAVSDLGWQPVVDDMLPALLGRTKVLAGVALVERADEQTAAVSVLAPEAWAAEEPRLLVQARALMPRLPFAEIDLLLLDEIGKDISGAGLDTNVVGRKEIPDKLAGHGVRHIAVRSLSRLTGGNAIGVGLADFARSRVIRRMDAETTRVNALTSGHLMAAMVPLHFETDIEILRAAMSLIGLRSPSDARILWARNTLQMERTICSVALAIGQPGVEGLDVVGQPLDLEFDDEGNLPDDLSDLWNLG